MGFCIKTKHRTWSYYNRGTDELRPEDLVRPRIALGVEPRLAPQAVVPPLALHARDVLPEVEVRRQLPERRRLLRAARDLALVGELVHVARPAVRAGEEERHG